MAEGERLRMTGSAGVRMMGRRGGANTARKWQAGLWIWMKELDMLWSTLS